MFELLAFLALIVSFVALSRAGKSQQQVRSLAQRLEVLETELQAARQPPGTGLSLQTSAPDTASALETASGMRQPHHPPQWPEAQSASSISAPPEALPRPRGPSLWGPQFSRARISLIGGVLVLGGLAFTLRALGAPAWTLLLAVFAFGGLLYFNARWVPWPVSGALRGLGYGVTALGVGSLSPQLPGDWGPGAVMLGLLGLSAALLQDALRRRALLLGALAVGGSALSTWMLTDDLGRWSIPAAGAALLLAAVAVWQGRAEQHATPADEQGDPAGPDAPASRRAALALTLGAAGAVPLGWVVASASHAQDGLWSGTAGLARMTFQLTGGPLALLPWLAFSLLALSVPLALLTRRRQGLDGDFQDDRPDGVTLGAAWAILAPQVLVAAAVGAAFNSGWLPTGALALIILAALVMATHVAWTRRNTQDSPLANTVAGSLTAGAAGVAGALALSVLGPRTEALALAGVTSALVLVGLSGRSRFWLRTGALGLGVTALWGAWGTVSLALGTNLLASPDVLRTALMGAVPAALGLLAAWRLGQDSWATAPPPARAVRAAEPGQPQFPAHPGRRWSPTLLAGLCSAVLAVALLPAGAAVLAGGVVLAGAVLWTHAAHEGGNTVPFWTAAPLLTLGSLLLLFNVGGSMSSRPLSLGFMSALLAGAGLLRATPGTFATAPPRLLAEGTALTVLALALARTGLHWWPMLGLPGSLALLALLTSPLRLTLGWSRMDTLLGLGGLILLSLTLAGWPGGAGAELGRVQVAAPGGVVLAAVWWLTRTAPGLKVMGRLSRPFGGLPPEAGAHPPVTLALWLGGWALLVPLALGVWLSPQAAGFQPWLVASSLALLAVGLEAAVRAHRSGGTGARALWTAGLALIAGAGVKGALLDAASFPNASAGLGIAVLVTGLSLLAVAILAPRPAAPVPSND
ncbi:hypothetical protein [Deinococcus humi]|uniref:DUF2339 domain-containing protein n=1 Tax=Deinococcus humi TaxID=662880 RepID=A0A7W8JYD5_9DEIO|nr:hypothetical protein [Deinococcus humi]MBB5364218.1 hypothetical protein [Deinococcus humi]GGO35541.1 hypothetical protein GCM10008949_38180 [Deinococcus humi]